MARVMSIGGIVTINRMAEEVADPSIVNLNVRLFAKLDLGLLAIDPRPQSMAIGMGRNKLHELPDNVRQTMAMAGALPAGHRDSYLGGVVAVLADQFGVHTDVETLMALPFDLLPDSECRDALLGPDR